MASYNPQPHQDMLHASAYRLVSTITSLVASTLGAHYPTYRTYMIDILLSFDLTRCAKSHKNLSSMLHQRNPNPFNEYVRQSTPQNRSEPVNMTAILYNPLGGNLYGANELTDAVKIAQKRVKNWLEKEHPEAIYLHNDLVGVLSRMSVQPSAFDPPTISVPKEFGFDTMEGMLETYFKQSAKYFHGVIGLARLAILSEAGRLVGQDWSIFDMCERDEVTEDDVYAVLRSSEEHIEEHVPIPPKAAVKTTKARHGGSRGVRSRGRGRVSDR
ncbi:hypothetical protein P280DRAFT_523139 [Massarina eburnea CBS 473.64]|uniref:Uncharacterized protein n=1 Tax=Massarina eburnea CBS 473.64 TaxID=1395130 RepID=A0A6A6RJT2_9PLEO|nr:hypothetical protein P280DRAFT_523139 [Massarina eburnea CBS 473.64]